MAHTPIGARLEGALCSALARFYQSLQGCEEWPVYFTGVADADKQQRIAAWTLDDISALNALERLPWPDWPCIVCYAYKWQQTIEFTFLATPEGEFDWFYDLPTPTSWWPGATQISQVIIGHDDGAITDTRPEFLGRVTIAEVGPNGRTYLNEAREFLGGNPTPGDIEPEWREAWEADLGQVRWVSNPGFLPGRSGPIGQHLVEDTVRDTIVEAFAPILRPCGYLARGIFRRGVGANKSMQRRTRGKAILSFIPAERLYREWPDARQQEIAPHFRRGHVRNLWALAGIDRHALPRDPAERLRLSIEAGVRRIYINPTWVGETRGSTDRFDWEIQTGETALDVLYKSLRHTSN